MSPGVGSQILPTLTSGQYEALLFPLLAVDFDLVATVEEGLDAGFVFLYIRAAPLAAV